MNKKVKVLSVVLLFSLLCIPGYFIARYFIFYQIERRVINTLNGLLDQNIRVQYKSLKVDPGKRALILTGLEMKFDDPDSLCLSMLKVDRVEVNGINLTSLLSSELKLDTIILRCPRISLNDNYNIPQQQPKGNFLKRIQIDLLMIDSGSITVIDSASCNTLVKAKFNASVKDISAKQKNTSSYTWNMGEAIVTGARAKFPTSFYALNIKQLFFNKDKKLVQLDSIQISPLYTRDEFAKKAGHQVDQFTCAIPFITMHGVQTEVQTYRARAVRLGLHLEAYRDKRYPRKIRAATILPVLFLQNLHFQLQIDSLSILNSYVSYEEFPEGRDKSGKIEFNDLNALISNISTRSSVDATMNVNTRLMKTGILNANLTFPSDAKKPYWVKGSLTNFSMPEINKMLEPLANTKIESGELQEMKFQFQYNTYRSDGEVQLLYTNLLVHRLRKNPAKSINKFISFLLNVAVRNTRSKNDAKMKRTGTIQMYRDSQRGIFNYWWKSILSGVESQFGLSRILKTRGQKKSHPKHKHSK